MSDDFSEPVKRGVGVASRKPLLESRMPRAHKRPAGRSRKGAQYRGGGPYHRCFARRPRYDPDLLPEERSGPSNGIWLCQNCAKLVDVDNDAARFTVEMLRVWKAGAEAEAKTRIGKTNVAAGAVSIDLKVYERIRMEPIVPRRAGQAEWMVESVSGGCYVFQKLGATGRVEMPSSFIEKVHRFGGNAPALIQLAGRLQWSPVGQRWLLLSDKPTTADEHGFSRSVDFNHPSKMNYPGGLAWCREDRLAERLGQGRHIFYTEDGKCLRVAGPDIDQILVSDRP